ncbi:MAG TPA: HAD hydrolase-like protein, partial [Desulfatirhabdiaceae bacterium]|nr:HAD hydrolase-like protein [Desulfatirhabdiaceae bacterium]
HAVMIGDSARDIECGKNVGCSTVLVLTGNGPYTSQELDERGMIPDAVTADLKEAVEWIISR